MTSAFSLALVAHIAGIVLWVGGLLAACHLLSGRERETAIEVQGSLARRARELLKALAHPGAAITVAASIALLLSKPTDLQQVWLHIKLTLVVILIAADLLLTVGVHGLVSRGTAISAGRLRLTRGVIVLLFLAIVFLAVVKP
ncbi:MAG TPA: CopD family protein [Terriglobia bacterium]|nr:CopD family protein [Terriglobia bacterium]